VYFSSRYLRSNAYERNMRAQRIVVSEFGTMAHPDPCKSLFARYWSAYMPFAADTTDNALVNLMQTGDQVFAMTETPRMCRIDPDTLETLEKVPTQQLLYKPTVIAEH
jgi:carotenoid cleavage dioxygenase-like enzyme